MNPETTAPVNYAGTVIMIGLQLLKFLATIAIYIGIFVEVYWPILGIILDNPVSALWALPLGFFIGAVAFVVQTFILDLLFALPMAAALWLAQR